MSQNIAALNIALVSAGAVSGSSRVEASLTSSPQAAFLPPVRWVQAVP